jgi:hypothetical protein
VAWTSPRTWVAGETLTAALLNVHVRDNMKALGDPWTAWTPTITAQAGTFTTVSGAGRYAAPGKLITWSAAITITTVGTASGLIKMTLPVAARAIDMYVGAGREHTSTGKHLLAWTDSTTGASACFISLYDNTSAIGVGTLILGGTYESA